MVGLIKIKKAIGYTLLALMYVASGYAFYLIAFTDTLKDEPWSLASLGLVMASSAFILATIGLVVCLLDWLLRD